MRTLLGIIFTRVRDVCAKRPIVACSRCKQKMTGRGHAWAYGTVAHGTLCEKCFTLTTVKSKPWAQTSQRSYEWMQGDGYAPPLFSDDETDNNDIHISCKECDEFSKEFEARRLASTREVNK